MTEVCDLMVEVTTREEEEEQIKSITKVSKIFIKEIYNVIM